MDITTSVTDWV